MVMTSKERIRAAIEHKETDRIPKTMVTIHGSGSRE